MSTGSHNILLASLILALGLVGAAFVVGEAVKDVKMADRFVTVRGLSERDVKADLAVWDLRYRSTGNDLAATQAVQEAQRAKIVGFLTAKGFKAEEIQPTSVRVFDRKAQEYGGSNDMTLERYMVESGLQLRTHQIDLTDKVAQATSELVSQGITLVGDAPCGSLPSFMFTKLNDIKPDMMGEATRNAREAAQQFAKDAEAAVGTIRQATQGYFSINPRDSTEGQSSYNCDAASVHKRVRVVTTVEYYLE